MSAGDTDLSMYESGCQIYNNDMYWYNIMSTDVLIDNQLNGWANDNKSLIGQFFSKIQYVKDLPNLGPESSDSDIASFCKDNEMNLLTSDKEAYDTWLEKPKSEVCISLFDTDEKSGQRVYCIRRIV